MKWSLFLVILIAGCSKVPSKEDATPFAFTEIDTCIAPTVCGSSDPTEILEVNGTGLALFDYDNDDDLDLFVVNAASLDDLSSGPGCRLYRNISQNGLIEFVDVTLQSGIDLHAWCNGVAVGDIDGDGFKDLYVTCYGPNVLLKNNGDTTFSDLTDTAGVGDEGWGTSAAFGDLDRDGDLDLYVCNYLEFDLQNPPKRTKYKGVSVLGGPHGMQPQHDIVYENMGDGTFTDVTTSWGFYGEPAFSLNVVVVDFDGDGHQDVYVGNDSMGNKLFRRTEDEEPVFTDVALQTGSATNGDGSMQATMGIAVADIDGNEKPDLFSTNFSSDTNTLHLNVDGSFKDRTTLFGLGLPSRTLLGWSCGFHDFDLDGDEDLLIVNGHVYPEATAQRMDSDRSQPMMWMARVGNRFVQVHADDHDVKFRDRAAVFGDLDLDGDIDVIIAQRDGQVRVLRNDAKGNTLTVHVNGIAVGTALHLTLDDGSVQSRWIHGGGGFQSSVSTDPQFTIPKGRTPVSLKIIASDGTTQVLFDLPKQGGLTISLP